MERHRNKDTRVIALDPCPRGFGFVVLEGSQKLLDWGVAQAKSQTDLLLRLEARLLRYRPACLILETGNPYRRHASRQRTMALERFAREQGVEAVWVRYSDVQHVFAGAGGTKYKRALALAELYEELRMHLPAKRRAWDSEDDRMHIFDAAAIGVTFFASL